MVERINPEDPKTAAECTKAAAEILRRHEMGEAEANITSAVRDFLILTKLVKSEDIVEESAPSLGSRRAVDLKALDTFIEFKREIGSKGRIKPDPQHVAQIDDYLEQSAKQGRVRMGVLTDGKHWLLRWPGAGEPRNMWPYACILDGQDDWFRLFKWLRDRALYIHASVEPSRDTVAERFGQYSPSYDRDIDQLNAIYQQFAMRNTIQIKRRLWQDLLMAALGEIAHSETQLDKLFVRHTYLTTVVGMAVQASFGIDIEQMAANSPADLLQGNEFHSKTGLQGIVESDFFSWPTEFGQEAAPLLKTLARSVARFDWQKAPTDIAAILYETVIPADERRRLGEYYTPDWLARRIVRELVEDPLNQTVLDPACGSGAFIAEAVAHFMDAAYAKAWHPEKVLDRLRDSVVGIDVHPVAVHLARSAWVLAARPAIQAARSSTPESSQPTTDVTAPIYLGDALQLRFRSGDLFANHNVTVQVGDKRNTELVFPRSLVERAEVFDALMSQVARAIDRGADPLLALDDSGITDPTERDTLKETIKVLQWLHAEKSDHIWAYYTRNLVRPVALSERKVDVIVGNPPWINYNRTINILRRELERQSKSVYGIWTGGRYATHQDVAGLFFARSVDLYLKDGGLIGMVMPHSALQTGQHAKWRKGEWQDRVHLTTLSVDFSHKTAWDLEGLTPNNFFPIPASVAFARRLGVAHKGVPLVGNVERWLGPAGSAHVQRISMGITDTSARGGSPYIGYSRQGATIVPRRLFFVEETANPAVIQAGGTVTVNPREGSYDKRPWSDLDVTDITGQTVETQHLYDVHLGETLAPYVTLDPLKAVLPFRSGEYDIPRDKNEVGGLSLGGLQWRMRDRWQAISSLWEAHKEKANKLKLVGRLDYHGELSAQLQWQQHPARRPVRVVYSSSGEPTAAVLSERNAIVDYTLFWVVCRGVQEANYLLAIINSGALASSVNKYTTANWTGKTRHLQKHLWKLPIPAFDAKNPLHREVASAGRAAASAAARQLAMLRKERGDVGVTVVRRELRAWLRTSKQGQAVERAVEKLLAG